MDLVELCKLYSAWPKVRAPLKLLSKWDGPRGMIFESHDDSGDEIIDDVAQYLGGYRVDIPPGGIRKAEWPERVERYVDGSLPIGALKALGAERLCLVVRDIDRQREWVLFSIRALMEQRGVRPFCCVATTHDASRVDHSVRSFFRVVRKTGRPRSAE